ncbi:hypothetical protein ACIBEA_00965 [Streptomyces sp. NPDC051555]|uniref:hypothetical protein n=1 Tax=Streptomyces sp. NPDC051555 TaxID=3365657 RepID=UPI00378D0005
MPAASRCFLALTVLLACGASALTVGDGLGPGAAGHRYGSAAVNTLAAEPLDTSWGDGYIAPQH